MIRPKGFRYFHAIAMLFVAMLLIANTLAVKIIHVGGFTLPAGILCFPITYIVGDCLTEVYGFEKARTVIWWGFICLALMSLFYYCATLLPPAPFWTEQSAFGKLFGFSPRIAIASFVGFLAGSFLNAYVLSKMKVKTKGKYLKTRINVSTVAGEGADSLLFNCIAFIGVFGFADVLTIAFSGFVLKTLYEFVMSPLTEKVIEWLKRKEEEDAFDVGANYNPFKG